MSDQTPSNSTASSSQEPKSTTPIALRTRRCETQVSFFKAAQLKQCKICPSSFPTLQRLRKHVLNHKSNTKRRKALEAIDSLIQNKGILHPSPTCSKTREEVVPTSLFSKFKVFPELFTETVEPMEKVIPQVSNAFQYQKENSIHNFQNDNSQQNFSKSISENRGTLVNNCQLDVIPTETSNLLSEPIETSTKSDHSDNNITNSPPEEPPPPYWSYKRTYYLAPLPLLKNRSPISNILNSQSHHTSNITSNNNLVQEQLSSPINNQTIIITSASKNNKDSSLTCSKKEKDLSILDLILTNSQESLDGELSNNLSPPPKALLSPTNSKSCHSNNSSSRFHFAAKEGLCLICSNTIVVEDILQHLYKHKPCPLRAKCLEGFRSYFPPNKIPVKKSSSSVKLQEISSIELTFREKFPE
ncbi:hypothetical protein NPIL_219931 [Nephila pilipes]|uniref:C2H2-type domain-containing protein n=1 Tax=Nephila pilipes TaxID=299642 RepID=A0A8X6PES3_NEPPI|nr:hypothetical protein NPIL_219931 [Nephila pilipes]